MRYTRNVRHERFKHLPTKIRNLGNLHSAHRLLNLFAAHRNNEIYNYGKIRKLFAVRKIQICCPTGHAPHPQFKNTLKTLFFVFYIRFYCYGKLKISLILFTIIKVKLCELTVNLFSSSAVVCKLFTQQL